MIKRFLFRSIILAVLFTGILAYAASLNGIDIRRLVPAFKLPSFANTRLPDIPDIKLPAIPDLLKTQQAPATTTKVYKWHGADGSWHFSEQMPEGIEPEEIIILHSNTNIIQSLPKAASSNTVPPTDSGHRAIEQNPQTNLNPYRKKAIDKLFTDARGVQANMDKHNQGLAASSQAQ